MHLLFQESTENKSIKAIKKGISNKETAFDKLRKKMIKELKK